jgi:hypothetical protein
MNDRNIAQQINVLQVVKEDPKRMNQRFAFTKLIQSLIREYGEYHDQSLVVDISDLSNVDKRLLISHVVDAEEFEWACANPTRLEQIFNEHKRYIQELFDDESADSYAEAMEERGLCRAQYSDNGESYWVRR